jgi:hypothetical protein
MSAIADVWQAQTCAAGTTHYVAACLDRYSASHLVLSPFDDTLSGGKTTLIETINRKGSHSEHGPHEEVPHAHQRGQPTQVRLACPADGLAVALQHWHQG